MSWCNHKAARHQLIRMNASITNARPVLRSEMLTHQLHSNCARNTWSRRSPKCKDRVHCCTRACSALQSCTTDLASQPHMWWWPRRPGSYQRHGTILSASSYYSDIDNLMVCHFLTEQVYDTASKVQHFEPHAAADVLSAEQRQCIHTYINRFLPLLLCEAANDVTEFITAVTSWPLSVLQQEGRVLLGLAAQPAGRYYDQLVVRLYKPSPAAAGADQLWAELPHHNFVPGGVVLLSPGCIGPLDEDGIRSDAVRGVVTERSQRWITIACQDGPLVQQLGYSSGGLRLDQGINTIATERAILALASLWCRPSFSSSWIRQLITRMLHPFQAAAWACVTKDLAFLYSSQFRQEAYIGNAQQSRLREWRRKRAAGMFQGSALANVILTAQEEYNWAAMPAHAGGMTCAAIVAARRVLSQPHGGRSAALGSTAHTVSNSVSPSPGIQAMQQQLQPQLFGLVKGFQGHGLDNSQLYAIAMAVVNPLMLLHGPPGTGKTTTIAGLLFLLRKRWAYKGRILAAAQSNVAVDNMLEAALTRGGLQIVRIGEPAKVRSSLRPYTLKELLDKASAKDWCIQAARREQERLRQQLRGMSSDRPRRRRRDSESRPLIYKPTKKGSPRYKILACLDKLAVVIAQAQQRIIDQLIRSADVVGVTCAGAGGPELFGACFDMVVMDEGSQASEPESLIPIMKGSKRLVLVGDHKQLPPVIKSRKAVAGGLARSLFERLMELGAPSAMLQVQYRSHPELMSFINQQFYDNKLVSGGDVKLHPCLAKPKAFVEVDGTEHSTQQGSKYNHKEASVVKAMVVHLVRHCGLQPGDIGVITPYAAQRELVSRQLEADGFNVNSTPSSDKDEQQAAINPCEIEVKSVDGYQGREKEVILLSLVRANADNQVGFVDDWRRANVALSRAKRGLVVVGHVRTLRRGSSTWQAYIDHTAAADGLMTDWFKCIGSKS